MTRPQRAFVFSREYPPITVGGTSTVARNLSTALTDLGWEVVVVSSQPYGGADRRDKIAGVLVHRTWTNLVYNRASGVGDASVLTHRRMYVAATRLADEFGRPDVVLLPDLFCYPEAALFGRHYDVPIVDVLLQDFRTLTCYDRDAHHVTTGVSADRTHLLALERKALEGSAHTVFISAALADAVTGFYPDLHFPHSVIHLGVDAREMAAVGPATANLARARGDRPLLVACGRLVPVKGFDALLHALALLGPGAADLAIVGVGPDEPHLRRTCDELGLQPQVSFVGEISRAAALSLMAAATVGVVPSLWESFCYVCAEMMALARPVVATAVDSLNELMPSDEYGYRVAVTGPSSGRSLPATRLAAAIGVALTDPVDATRRGAAAQERILTHFTNDRFGEAMSDLCTKIAGNGNA